MRLTRKVARSVGCAAKQHHAAATGVSKIGWRARWLVGLLPHPQLVEYFSLCKFLYPFAPAVTVRPVVQARAQV